MKICYVNYINFYIRKCYMNNFCRYVELNDILNLNILIKMFFNI